ncbi:XRE family transcriptional regulator (plasmid) [Rhizobium rosettiformans]|uniref:XRE family transcriptional regulator n=1 Tax=Rhizobium rosettiformans TaxID=1368430 RepID=A0ABX7F293_9HYPH|nr:helix-turn-helix transcriptional regulator [Rhizobium rosettiformans]QRF54320.1 XRE family transcriptional regulator [Rhizobium rosettiformans]
MDTRKTIGWNVRLLRVELGLSQERLALETDIDRSYVGRIERGTENVTVAALDAIARALGVPVSRLFVEPDEIEPPPPLRSGRKRRSS